MQNLSQTGTEITDFVPLFIGGAPRSGTTALHGLLCTSPRANKYIEEVSYLALMMNPFEHGLAFFDLHTRYYFKSREDFYASHGAIIANEVRRTWDHIGRPEILALKSPQLTPAFHHLAKMIPTAKFVATIRDPRATISSHVEVLLRKNGKFPPISRIEELCAQYVQWYGLLLDPTSLLEGRLCLIDYNQLVLGSAGNAIEKLEAFGLGPLCPEKIWEDSVSNPAEENAGYTQWLTPLYGAKLSTDSVERYRTVLPADVQALILERCGDTARRAGLELAPPSAVTAASVDCAPESGSAATDTSSWYKNSLEFAKNLLSGSK